MSRNETRQGTASLQEPLVAIEEMTGAKVQARHRAPPGIEELILFGRAATM